jgi:D-alanyl-D-alanine carboxypeptidase (penicillin-binding protein 5/6)
LTAPSRRKLSAFAQPRSLNEDDTLGARPTSFDVSRAGIVRVGPLPQPTRKAEGPHADPPESGAAQLYKKKRAIMPKPAVARKSVANVYSDCSWLGRVFIAVAFSSVFLLSGPHPAEFARGETQADKVPGQQKSAQSERPTRQFAGAAIPQKNPADALDGPPFVTARSWAIADGKTGAILWGHDEAKTVDMASTTKIMTAFVVLRLAAKEPGLLEEIVTFSKRADDTIGSTADVKVGERLPVRELLFGLLLPSGNDAAVAIAEHFGGRLNPPLDAPNETDPLRRFIAEMNRIAVDLGLKETHFINPNGLPADGHHSSARDLARLTRYALALPTFAAYVSTPRHACAVVDARGQRRDVVWNNTNRLLDTEGYDGVKTGTTRAAGECLVASGRRSGDHLIIVILGASSTEARYADARNLFRYSWLMRGHRPENGRPN